MGKFTATSTNAGIFVSSLDYNSIHIIAGYLQDHEANFITRVVIYTSGKWAFQVLNAISGAALGGSSRTIRYYYIA